VRRSRIGLALTSLVTLVLVVAGPVGAAGADVAKDERVEALGLVVEAGLGGFEVAGTWRPVTVTLAPDAPVRGRLLLATTRAGTTVLQSRDVEVAAGTEKRYRLLAPPGTDAQVQLVEEGRDEPTTVRPRRRPASGVLVGVLGGPDPSTLPGVTLPTTDQRLTTVAVDDDLLALGPRALHSLGTLVVRQSDLVALPDADRGAVARRVAEGGNLLVVGATDPELGLPWRAFTGRDGDGLEPAPGAWGALAGTLTRGPTTSAATAPDVVSVAAGRGRLVATTWDLGEGPLLDPGPWEHLAHPAGDLAGDATRELDDLPAQVDRAFAGVVGAPPSVGWLAGFFVLYVVVAGPVVGIAMSRRRRPELAWVVLPLVTALFAGAAFVGAGRARPQVGTAADVVAWVDGVGTATAVGGVRAPQAGQHTLVLDGTGWDVTSASWDGGTRITQDQDTTVTLALPPQSFGAVVARRPVTTPPPLDVEVALFADEARVEVTNISGHDLTDVTLRAALVHHRLAQHLPSGETVVDAVPLDTLPAQDAPFVDVWDGPARRGHDDPSALAALLRWDLLDGAPGTVWVTATTADGAGPVRSVDDGTPAHRGTLLAVGATPSVTDDATTPFEVQRDLVTVGAQTWSEGPLTLSGSGPATLRFRLPAEGELASVVLDQVGGCCMGPGVVPVPDVPERCGILEVRDQQTGDVLEARDVCGEAPPCPPDAIACEWMEPGDGGAEGAACFEQGPCRDLTWTVEDPLPDRQLPGRLVDGGMQVWDHVERSWVDHATVVAGAPITDVERWVGPLGDVWVRASGEFTPFDLAPQGVAAELRGSA
jgi:hypothetical protein